MRIACIVRPAAVGGFAALHFPAADGTFLQDPGSFPFRAGGAGGIGAPVGRRALLACRAPDVGPARQASAMARIRSVRERDWDFQAVMRDWTLA